MAQNLQRPRRSVLYVPASNEKAIAKLASLDCDAVIFDLEDAVAPDAKATARENLRAYFDARRQGGPECVIRVNPLASEWGTEDLLAARACNPDAILLPKADTPRDIHDVDDMLDETDAPEGLRLWIMVETAKAVSTSARWQSSAATRRRGSIVSLPEPTTSSRKPVFWRHPTAAI